MVKRFRNARAVLVSIIGAMLVSLFSSSCFADIPNVGAAERQTVSLNGVWKFSLSDDPAYSAPSFDDSAWTTRSIPDDGSVSNLYGSYPQSIEGGYVFWYRKSFTIHAADRVKYLKFDRVLDEAEIWVNGTKLTNPGLHGALSEKQFGSYWGYNKQSTDYYNLHSFDWNDVYDVSSLLVEGTNTIAVRINDDPRKEFWIIRQRPDDTYAGKAGILGDVKLIRVPGVYIAGINRAHPATVDTATYTAEHLFDIPVRNDTASAMNATVKLTIRDRDNTVVFDQTVGGQSIPAGGVKSVSFSWSPRARFMSYTATAEIWNGASKVDAASISFHGTVIETKAGRKLYVNGEPFLVKGLNGGATMYNEEKGRSFLELAKLAGANAIRGDAPSPGLLAAAEQYGLLILPSATDSVIDFSELLTKVYDNDLDSDKSLMQTELLVKALRESPNVLAFGIGNEFTGTRYADIEQMLGNRTEAVRGTDPYRRPSLYSNHNGPYVNDGADVMAFNLYNHSANGYKERIDSLGSSQPAILTEWGLYKANAYNEKDYEANIDHLTKRWYDSVLAQGWSGVMYYSGLTDYKPRHPGLSTDNGSLELHPEMVEGLKQLFDDVAVIYRKPDGEHLKLLLINRREYRLENVQLTFVTPQGGTVAYTVGDMAPGQQVETADVAIGIDGAVNLYVDYTTHGGLGGIGPEASFFFDTGAAAAESLAVDHFADVSGWALGAHSMNGTDNFGFTANNGSATMWYRENSSSSDGVTNIKDTLYYDKNNIGLNIAGYRYLSVDAAVPANAHLTVEAWIDGVAKRLVGYYKGNGSNEKLYFNISGNVLEKLRISIGEPDGDIGGSSGQPVSVTLNDISVHKSGDRKQRLDDFTSLSNWKLGAAPANTSYQFASHNGEAEMSYANTSGRDILHYNRDFNVDISLYSRLMLDMKLAPGTFVTVDVIVDGQSHRVEEYTTEDSDYFQKRYYDIRGWGTKLNRIVLGISEPPGLENEIVGERRSASFRELALYMDRTRANRDVADLYNVGDWSVSGPSMAASDYGFASNDGIAEMWYNGTSGRDSLAYYKNQLNMDISRTPYLMVEAKVASGSFLTVEATIDGVTKRLEEYYPGNGSGSFEKRYYKIAGSRLEKLLVSIGEPTAGGANGQRASVWLKTMQLQEYLDTDSIETFDNIDKWTIAQAGTPAASGISAASGAMKLWTSGGNDDVLTVGRDVYRWIDGNAVLSLRVKPGGGDAVMTVEVLTDGTWRTVGTYNTGTGTGDYERKFYPLGGVVLEKVRLSLAKPAYDNGATVVRSVYVDDLLIEPGLPNARHIVYKDNFDNGFVGSFPIRWKNETGNGTWSIQQDGTNQVLVQSAAAGLESMITTGNDAWDSYIVRADVKPGSASAGQGLLFRYKDMGNYYEARLESGKAALYRKVGGALTKLWEAPYSYDTNTYYQLAVELRGRDIALSVNGVQIGSTVNDTSIAAGKVGFRTYGTSASFDNLIIERR
ncbi:family 16 glycoside hydrolase [Paenibacillus ginsengarvi]|uniref:Beta-galactosidase n=1 Tax=Paenibacillus ginsengarvi TaxID=400777 RepID=A0A3B0BKA0_9BACL|nr:family 16 glycoside hydrolase [Paenibacillus ginsengarvi]RKN71886.1 hypothetical protein D7M11_29095 [Paenibacillus ginsengarvi]